MSVASLIGRVAVLHLNQATELGGTTDGTARFIIDCLNAEQTAAIARAVLADLSLSGRVEMRLPQAFLSEQELPGEILTEKPATYYRSAPCGKPVLLLANTGDDEEQSLKELTRIGAAELQEHPALWVRAAGERLALSAEHLKWWEKALAGLFELRMFSLDRLGAYVLRVRAAVEEDGLPLVQALGSALPALRLPRETAFFNSIREPQRGHASQWKRLFSVAFKKRACFLVKQTPTQLVLSEDELRSTFEKVRDSIPEVCHEAVKRFIASPSGWNAQSATLAECEWEDVKPLFDGLRREKYNLGAETQAFYEERDPDLLTDAEREYLRVLVQRRTTEAAEDDVAFYEHHRRELKDDRKLRSAWELFVFGRPRECEDFISGLALSLESLFSQAGTSKNRRLRIRCDRATKKELRDLNVDAGLYFAQRYRGLQSMLGDRVSWSVGQLFAFDEVVEAWKKAGGAKSQLNRSIARAALHLKFTLELEVDLVGAGTATYSAQLIWKFDPNTVASEFVGDWTRIQAHPLVACRTSRVLFSAKGRFQTVDLANVKTFQPAHDRDRGSFVPVYRRANDIGITWRANLALARGQALVSAETEAALSARFDDFAGAYERAVEAFAAAGVAAGDAFHAQLTAFASLLDTMSRKAKGDRNRELLLRPLLQIGAVEIEGGAPAIVVAPWHPLRLFAMWRKADLVARMVRHLLQVDNVLFGEPRLFFKDLASDLAHPFYPEVVLGWTENKPTLLALSDVVQDYTLHEMPVASDAELDDTNENPTDGSNRVLELVQRYLALHPHEHANMSVVLFNCDSARLPHAVVDKVSALYEDEEDVRCQVLLRHVDMGRLRDLYRDIVGLTERDGDAFNASEATQDFMARLRICIIADQAPPPDPKDGCPYDIVFSQDVVARHARQEWYFETAKPVELDRLVPSQWSRRRPAAKDDMRSVVYLCCPVQSREGWAFLTAVTSFIRGDWNEDEGKRLLPARELDFRDPRTARIFDETHNLGNWVVNYDELLDRRQLLNQNVRIIRYKQLATQGRNVIISSKAPLGLLKSMIVRRLRELTLDIDGAECSRLAQKFIDDANDISGDIVLRAAKRGRNASELMGVVLSRYLIRHELGTDRYFGTYFLDDYAEWLGHKEEQIADILVLSPEASPDGGLRLAMITAEAKYGGASNVAAKRKESQRQLRDTVARMEEAIFGHPGRMDRPLWLARLSDLILDGVQIPASAQINLADWRRSIREGECQIYLRGYSHVFVAESVDGADVSDLSEVAGLEDCFQEVYGRPQLRDLVMKYMRDEDPQGVRRGLGDRDVWSTQRYRRPTDLAVTVVPSAVRSPEAKAVPTHSKKAAPTPTVAPAPVAQKPGPTPAPPVVQPTAPRWAYPIEDLVSSVGDVTGDEAELGWLRETEQRLRSAFQQLQLQSKIVFSKLTPNAALVKFAGSASMTVDQVLRRRSELLTTYGLPIIGVQPEPGVVSVSIARASRRVVALRDAWARWTPTIVAGNQSLLVGLREDDGELLFLAPGTFHAPHTLIAGATGSGKSVLMQNIIMGIAATNRPEQARIVLIDPKQGVDYFTFEGLPHLEGGLIDEQGRAIDQLQQLVEEMDARYARFKAARVPNLMAYNKKVPGEALPTIWLIHDEFAEWMLVEEYKEQVSAVVGRLGVKARAAGIYLVFAAQRPDANVMPMHLRANVGNRLILRVDSEGTSEIALGERGAERLLGRGHLLAKLEGESGLIYAQVPFGSSDFMEAIVARVRGDE